jgi:arsenate reductase
MTMKLETVRSLLFVGTGNVGRSVMAEAYLNFAAQGRWKASSAGSNPTGKVHPLAATMLAEFGLRPELRSKCWDEFTGPDAPAMDVVITICTAAAAESSPVWPGAPRLMHWPVPDPTIAVGTMEDRMEVFRAVFALIRSKIDAFLADEAAAAVA